METYFKAVRVDGTSFRDPNFNWLTEDGVVEHPRPDLTGSARGYLSVATVASDCTGFSWPCRLLVVEPIGEVVPDNQYPHKRRGRAFTVVGEVEAWRAFGPNGKEVVAFFELLPTLTETQWDAARDASRDAARDASRDAAWDASRDAAWDAAWDAARDAARYAARYAARDAARDAAWDAAWDAARYAAWALVLRDVLSVEHFNMLTAPMRAAGIDFDKLM